MLERKLSEFVRAEENVDAGRVHRQLGPYFYLLERRSALFDELHAFYSKLAEQPVDPKTVRTQLKYLEIKGFVRRKGEVYEPVPVPREALFGLFDLKRARVGRAGAEEALQQRLYRKPQVVAPRKLKSMIRRVMKTAGSLIEKWDRCMALDLPVHMLLPVRKTGVLWCWFNNTFIYYEEKAISAGYFHSVRFSALLKLLRDLGFEEGILAYHTLGDFGLHLRRIIREKNAYLETVGNPSARC